MLVCYRFHKLVWGASGNGESGMIVGGCDNGRLQMYNASRVLAGDEGLVHAPERHTGPVKAVDFNSFQVQNFYIYNYTVCIYTSFNCLLPVYLDDIIYSGFWICPLFAMINKVVRQ